MCSMISTQGMAIATAMVVFDTVFLFTENFSPLACMYAASVCSNAVAISFLYSLVSPFVHNFHRKHHSRKKKIQSKQIINIRDGNIKLKVQKG